MNQDLVLPLRLLRRLSRPIQTREHPVLYWINRIYVFTPSPYTPSSPSLLVRVILVTLHIKILGSHSDYPQPLRMVTPDSSSSRISSTSTVENPVRTLCVGPRKDPVETLKSKGVKSFGPPTEERRLLLLPHHRNTHHLSHPTSHF